jgi:hypothetical protein
VSKAVLRKVNVKLPGIEGEWVADEAQRTAAWEMYVELVTRVAVQPLGSDAGMLREALSSLHALFGETRRILRTYGPDIAKPEHKQFLSFGALAVDVLNVWLRPFLAWWHPRLGDHESRRPAGVSPYQHEHTWTEAPALRAALEQLRAQLVSYADLLAEVCEIPSLHIRPE